MHSVFSDVPLARLILAKWRTNLDHTGAVLIENYVSMYEVVFKTPLCFSMMKDSILTHTTNGFEIMTEWLTPAQSMSLSEVLKTGSYTKAYCPFVKNHSITNVADSEPDTPWCNPYHLFALYVDEELAVSASVVDFVVRADTFSFLVLNILQTEMHKSNGDRVYMQRMSESLFLFLKQVTARVPFAVARGEFLLLCDE